MRGIFCIDPGESTGVAWGIVNASPKSTHTAIEAVRDRLFHGAATVVGEPMEQAHALYKIWTEFKFDCVARHCMDPSSVELVVEDFVLFPNATPGKNTTAPERVAWAFEGYRRGRYETYRKSKHYTEIIWQHPTTASRWKRDRKLMKEANAWIPGKDHERSAMAHMILRANTIMDNRAPARAHRAQVRSR